MKINSSLIFLEKKYIKFFIIIMLISCLSGVYNWINTDLNSMVQINLLLHICAGLIVSFIAPIYCYRHFRRVIGIRKPLVTLSGLFAALCLLLYISGSILILIQGHDESNAYHFDIHRWGAITIISLIVIHILLFKLITYKKNKENIFTSLAFINNKKFIIRLFSIFFIYILSVTATGFIINIISEDDVYGDLPKNYDTPYGEHPFLPSQTDTYEHQLINKEAIANSHTCIECHQDISKQWLSSTHRLAAADPTYVTNINLLAKNKGIAATRYCEGCHAPVALLTGELTSGGSHGGVSNTPANHEGVGCVSCHRATKAMHLDGVASYYFEPQKPYLFDRSENTILSRINHLLIKMHSSQHKSDMAQEFTKEPASCATCHSQFMDKDMNDWGWVKMQDEYSAWLSSPFAKQGDPVFGGKQTQRCQDCHMPLVKSSDPSADRDGMVRSHRFAAANTMLPFLNGDQSQLQKTIDFLQSDKMRITIEKPNRNDAIQSNLNIQESLRRHTETPFYLYLNEEASLTVSVANTGVGHNFPGGSTDINQAWVAFTVTDALGELVYQSGNIDKDNYLDPTSHIYQSIPIDRFGKHVWKHDLFNMVGRTYKNIIESGKTDTIPFEFSIPPWTKGPITITSTLRYRKLNTRYAKWALKELYTPLPIVDMARDTLVIDILKEPSSIKHN